MNRVLAEATVLPLHGQIAIQDVGTSDLPEWESGEERSVASEHSVYVATRLDTEGDVTIRVLEGFETDGLGECVFDGDLSTTSPQLEVGSPVAGMLERVQLSRGGYQHVRVFVSPADFPAQIEVLIEPRQ